MIRLVLFIFTLTLNASPLRYGSFTSHNRGTSTVLAAPHGGYDFESDTIAQKVAKKLNWSVVTANGFRTDDHPINVNRPTEGVGLRYDNELHSKRADIVYNAYRSCVMRLQKSPTLYVEIHGQGKFEHVDVATVGLTKAQARKVKLVLSEAFGEGVELLVEGVDQVFYTANGAKKFGLLSEVPLALHIELPWHLRKEEQNLTVKALVKALPLLEDALTSRRD